ncbi:MAG TPA: NADH-quinone oxidoreductase subunit A [Gaiellaceae bacterium]|nr:NADH-quinone oxidoreductase subunit A [Gaiellaceae bacterium]
MLSNWLPFLFYALLAAAIPASIIAFSFLLPRRPVARTRQKMLPFESGVSAGAPKQQRFSIQFYLVAILFIVFDIEVVFLYPLAVQLDALGWFGLGAMTFFVAMLLIPLLYDWKKGALDWK